MVAAEDLRPMRPSPPCCPALVAVALVATIMQAACSRAWAEAPAAAAEEAAA